MKLDASCEGDVLADLTEEIIGHLPGCLGREKIAMFSLLFGTGVRLGEAVDLLISNIGPQTITVKGKGQKVREIYLPQETRKAINNYLPLSLTP